MLDTYAELLARVEALEQGPTLKQLPLSALKDYMENDWQPDSGLLLQPASITTDLLADASVAPGALTPATLATFLKLAAAGDLHVGFGSVTCVWPGGSRLSTANSFAHGIVNSAGAAVTPGLVLYGSKAGALGTDWATTATSGSNITTQADNTDGTVLGAATSRSAYWLAIG